MSNTMQRFIYALRRLMDDHPLSKITVSEIAKEAGLSRKTFYNYFRDKYDLINWAVYSQFVQVKEDILAGNGWKATSAFYDFFATDRKFFANALSDMQWNSFGQYFSDILYEIIYANLFEDLMKTGIKEKWVDAFISMLVHSARAAIIMWLEDESEPDATDFENMVYTLTNQFCVIMCRDRRLKTGSQSCDLVARTFSEPSTLFDISAVHLPKPDEINDERQRWYMRAKKDYM